MAKIAAVGTKFAALLDKDQATPYNPPPFGEMAEWFNAPVLKTDGG